MSAPIGLPNDPPADEALAIEFGLEPEEYAHALEVLGRTPTYAELGVISVMWSEHCSYKSSRVHLARLPTEGPQVVQGPGENAGAVDIGDGFCAVFKMESHNHPSFIEPYQGAATGVGGILRDVFTMGARPIANLNSLRFGRPNHPRTRELVHGVVAGIGGYGNCIGVPTVGGEVQFDASYDGNILVNAFTVGIAKSDGLFFGTASGLGNAVMYVGARTGRDGIHGATMASASFEGETEQKLPTVQVGDPFMEKLLLECCLEIFSKDCLEGIQDMGAAGLTSSSVEMAARAGNGIELDLDAIPRRTKALTPYEMLLSESQERMLLVAKEGREQEVIDACVKWDLEVAIVGRVTDTGRFVCKATPGHDPLDDTPTAKDPQVVVDLPIPLLADEAPKYDRPQKQPDPRTLATGRMTAVGTTEHITDDPGKMLVQIMGSPNVGSRRWIYRQYDHVVRDGTVVGPGEGDAAVIRAFCEDGEKTIEKFLAIAVDCNGRHVLLDPFHGAAMAVAECARNLVCVGAKPLGTTDCLNFGNPEKPETMWRFARAIDGLAAACSALDVPVVSGNVSLYNETDGKPILPTPSVALVGLLESPEHRLTMAFREEGDVIAHLGKLGEGQLGGSELLMQLHGHVSGEAQQIDLAAERKLQDAMRALAKAQLLRSAHDLSEGGLGGALAESCITGAIGATVKLPDGLTPADARLFGEEPSRIVVSFEPDARAEVERICTEHGVPFTGLGVVGGDRLTVDGVLEVPVAELAEAHRTALDEIVGAD
ncbi:MAG: phosphoribosylformylglycinamidine synthase subunit PurL [Deltaproteobacteria bacterium]|nr:phosphoribosylformylglycinamidine synthase subunit PurL [Deltaproteobacteria bacterium]